MLFTKERKAEQTKPAPKNTDQKKSVGLKLGMQSLGVVLISTFKGALL